MREGAKFNAVCTPKFVADSQVSDSKRHCCPIRDKIMIVGTVRLNFTPDLETVGLFATQDVHHPKAQD